jgi:hypothetical protein
MMSNWYIFEGAQVAEVTDSLWMPVKSGQELAERLPVE